MQHFHKLRRMIRDARPIREFRDRLRRSCITTQQHANLLLKDAIQNYSELPHFSEYLAEILKYRQHSQFRISTVDVNFVDSGGIFNEIYSLDPQQRTLFMIACEKTDRKTVQEFLGEKGIQPYLRDRLGMTAIFYALRNPSLEEAFEILALLFQKYPELVREKISQKFSTAQNNKNAIFIAIERSSSQLVLFLLKNGVSPNEKLKDSGNSSIKERKYAIARSAKKIQSHEQYPNKKSD